MEPVVHPKEKIYFGILFIISISIYLFLGTLLAEKIPTSLIFLVYIMIAVVFVFVTHGIFIGTIRGNAIRISDKQFPAVYRLTQQLAKQMEINPIPQIYLLQAGGLLNAFATRFLGRNFVVIFSDVLELAFEKGESTLTFVICHELAHVKRGHLRWRWFLYPSMLIPFLGSAYSRACEYTCDSFGAHYQPEGATSGLLVLAAGKKLHNNVDPQEFCKQIESERSFWTWFSEIFSTHPHLTKRVKAVNDKILK